MSEKRVPTVEELSRDVYLDFAARMQHVVVENPVCQECGKNPSVMINHWGPIKAMCRSCLDEEQRKFDQHVKESIEADERWGWD